MKRIKYRAYATPETWDPGLLKRYVERAHQHKYARIILGVETELLKEIIKKYGEEGGTYLDFACGPGRILEKMKKHFKKSYGLDINKTSLSFAKRRNPECIFYRVNLLKDKSLKPCFDVITSFRYFLNHKNDAIKVFRKLEKNLKPNGIFIFNIHVNKWSWIGLRTLFRRYVLRNEKSINALSASEVKKSLKRTNLHVLEEHFYLQIPGRQNFTLFPVKTAIKIEFALSKIPLIKKLGTHILFVCKKNE